MSIQFKKIPIEQMKPLQTLASYSYHASKEGIVLLKNNNQVLPLAHKKVSVFGRIQTDYYQSGTGSGGLVNVRYVPSIIECLKDHPLVSIDMKMYERYQSWVKEHPFDEGTGAWASEPWAQVEMELDDETVKSASMGHEIGLIILGRTAGEDKDHTPTQGSYYLTDLEEKLLKQVTTYFKQTVVVLNVGSLIDLSFLDRYQIDGLVFAWHGGMYGALGLVDLLTGLESPSGKLPMTIAYELTDYPSNQTFGQMKRVIYDDDIYVGYRYFETFKPERVRYPFGFGLSYTEFQIKPLTFDATDQKILFEVEVKNIGQSIGKEVVQIYVNKPQGLLGKPAKELIAFAKTRGLNPGETEVLTFEIDLFKLASYDDLGHIYQAAFVLEKGLYQFLIGNDIKNTQTFGLIELEDDLITQKSRELNAPVIEFERLKPTADLKESYERVNVRRSNYHQRIQKEVPHEIPPNNQSHSLKDVFDKKITLDTFVGSLTVDELIYLTRGEGMSSPKVTAGTAAAFGGVTPELLDKGIPVVCAADGPSGIRMDSGFYASSIPIGTHLAASFNLKLVEDLYRLVGLEMRGYQIDLLLAPGMNIQRHPLNGRNFEYFSEDPLLTGQMAASTTIGLRKAGVSGTLKHVFGNNQETDRFHVDAVISERAQREIYLKGFEIAIKDGKANAIMTSYNPVNGLWTASNYEINKKLIRDEWGFKGLIVTDWWAQMNDFGGEGTKTNTKAMIISQNDIYMVISDARSNSNQDNTKESYQKGILKLSHLQRVASNILAYLMTTTAFYQMHAIPFKEPKIQRKPWFKVKQATQLLPTLNLLEVNQRKYQIKPYEMIQILGDLKSFDNIKADANILMYKHRNHVILKTVFDGAINIYHLLSKHGFKKEEPLVDLKHLNFEHTIRLSTQNWENNAIDLSRGLIHEGLALKDHYLNVDQKNALMSYLFEVLVPGKYIFEFKLSSDSDTHAQIPFSIYLNNEHKATLTIHGTKGKIVDTRTFVLMDEGSWVVSMKFNKSGINLYEFNVKKHG